MDADLGFRVQSTRKLYNYFHEYKTNNLVSACDSVHTPLSKESFCSDPQDITQSRTLLKNLKENAHIFMLEQ